MSLKFELNLTELPASGPKSKDRAYWSVGNMIVGEENIKVEFDVFDAEQYNQDLFDWVTEQTYRFGEWRGYSITQLGAANKTIYYAEVSA